jgi:hypothetical protein
MKANVMIASIAFAMVFLILTFAQASGLMVYSAPAYQSSAAAAAYNAGLAKLRALDLVDKLGKVAFHDPAAASTDTLGGPTQTRIAVCDRPDFQGFCDYPLITDGSCQWVF